MMIRSFLVVFFVLISLFLLGQSDNQTITAKSAEELATLFKNFSGLTYNESQLAGLENQVARLDSVSAEGVIVGAYSLMDSLWATDYTNSLGVGGNEIKLGFRLINKSQRVQVISFCFKEGNSAIENYSLSLSVQHTIEDFIRSSEGSVASIPDAMAEGINTYIGYVSDGFIHTVVFDQDDVSELIGSSSLHKSNTSDQNQDLEVNPYIEINHEQTFLSVSGVPIVIPGGAFVRFYPYGHKYQFCLKSFSLHSENNSNVYKALQFVSGHQFETLFSGYGYIPPTSDPRYRAGKHIRYSYEDYVQIPEVPEYPPYRIGREIGVSYGVVLPCRTGRPSSSYYTKTLARPIDIIDLSDPNTSSGHPLSSVEGDRYHSINQKLTERLSFTGGIPEAINWDPVLAEAVTVNTGFDVSGGYSCLVDSIVKIGAVVRALEYGLSFVVKASDGKLVTIIRHAGSLYYAYDLDPTDAAIDYMMYSDNSGWINVTIDSDNPVRDIVNGAMYVGEWLVIGGVVAVSIAAPFAVGYGAGIIIYGSYAAIPEAVLPLLILGGELSVAFVEAYVESEVTGNDLSNIVARNLIIVVGAEVVGGSAALTKLIGDFLDFKNGKRIFNGRRVVDDLDHVVTVMRNGQVVAKRNLKTLAKEMETKLGMSSDEVAEAFVDFRQHAQLAEFVIEEGIDGVRAWKRFKFHGDDLATDVTALKKLSNHFTENPSLYNYLADIDNFRAYKAYPSAKFEVLNAVKNIQGQNKLYNGRFSLIENQGCIGHLDDNVDLVMRDAGWLPDLQNSTNDVTTYKRLTGEIEPSGFEHFEVAQFRNIPESSQHAIDPSLPAPYWKIFRDGYSNNAILYRSSASDNFGASIDQITTPVYNYGSKIN